MIDIDKELDDLAMDQNEDLDKAIEKIIDRRMRRVAIKVVAVTLLIIALIFLGLSPLMSLVFTNPASANKGSHSLLTKTWQAYFESNYPYMECYSVEVDKDGFGCYTIYPTMIDHRGDIELVLGSKDPEIKMTRGKLSIVKDTGNYTATLSGRFYGYNGTRAWTGSEKAAEIKSIRQLPASAWVYVSVSGKNTSDITELKKIDKDKLHIQWAQVYLPKCDYMPGINLYENAINDNETPREDMTAKQLKAQYISNIKVMRENTRLWKGLGLLGGYHYVDNDQIKPTLDKAIKAAEKSDTLKTRNYCIGGTRDEIADYLEKTDIYCAHIDKVDLAHL